jgi:uncharacterized protein YndB with AHSA1/START domain
MKTTFNKDLPNKKMYIEREFTGTLEDVWQAWTDREILDQWWAPLPWKAETKKMDFREGGSWLYSMNGPEGEKHWAKADYKKIDTRKFVEVIDSFCDESGNETTDLPKMLWKISFKSSANGTLVEIEITFASQNDLEQIVAMGFQEGFNAAHENLDRILESKSVAHR